jgi:tungstate transport system permease protein
MTDGASALQLVLGGDPTLYAIVGLVFICESLGGRARGTGGAAVRSAAGADHIFPAARSSSSSSMPSWACRRWWSALAVYLLLSRSGPLGSLGLLFTPKAMIVAQALLVMPIIAALTRQTIEDLWSDIARS